MNAHHVTNNAKNVLPFPDRRNPAMTVQPDRSEDCWDPEDRSLRWGWFCLGGAVGGLVVFVLALAVL